ncbi:MAG: hypothetical protein A2189_09770, partial [Paenibacillus sp. RIFOXYA1_FULL_44_5]
MNRNQLLETSLQIILNNQADNGAFVACPNFATYEYSWLRDGTFIAYALDVSGHHEAAGKFYRWVHHAIMGQIPRLEKLLEKKRLQLEAEAADFLPARYMLDGTVADDEWPNFQLDGYGTWLWGLTQHVQRTGSTELYEELQKSISYTYDYLQSYWHVPNYDCWEEFGDRVHPATLACLYGGAAAIGEALQDERWKELAETIQAFILDKGVDDGHFIKSIGYGNIDASLLWLSVPFQVVQPEHPWMQSTVKLIEDKLLHEGGV